MSGKKQGKERLCHGDPCWLLPLFSHLKPLPLLNYLWTCVRFLILCFYFWAIRDWVLKKDFQKHFHFQHGLNFVLRAKITPQTTSLNGRGIWNFIFLAGILFWNFLLDHTTVITQELITLCTFSGPYPDAHTSYFNILILSNWNNLDGKFPLWVSGS